MIVKLTPENQTRLYIDDINRARADGFKNRTHYSIGDHLLLLMRRLDALEAQAIEPRRAETERLGAQHESAVATPCAPTSPTPSEGNKT